MNEGVCLLHSKSIKADYSTYKCLSLLHVSLHDKYVLLLLITEMSIVCHSNDKMFSHFKLHVFSFSDKHCSH